MTVTKERKKIGLREVRELKKGETQWDATVTGFGIRRQTGDAVSYILFYRTVEGRQRTHTIGRHGAYWTPDLARDEARKIIAKVVNQADPAADKKTKRHAATVSDLCDLYWKDAQSGRLLTRLKKSKKDSTLATDSGRIEKHIKPLLGRLKVAAVTREDVDHFMHDVAAGKTAGKTKSGKKRGVANVRGGKGTATRTVGLLGAIFTYAVRHRMRLDNPVHGVIRFADGVRQRRLSEEEYKALGKALRKAKADKIWPAAVGAARFLALTGWRCGEALDLRWADIDFDRRTAMLPDTKTERSIRPLSKAASNVLRGMTRSGDLIFPATRGDGAMTGFRKLWDRIAEKGGLPKDITPNVMRHSFISLAADMGYSEPTIASMVGHKKNSITSRYIHAADAVLLAATDAVTNKTRALMIGQRPPAKPKNKKSK